MRVGIIQSNYIPWRGYFDFISDVDLFVFHDDLQYTKQDWRNRNRIKTKQGSCWLSVPVKYNHVEQLIQETAIDYQQKWQAKHINLVKTNYSEAPFYEDIIEGFSNILTNKYSCLSELNIRLVEWASNILGISTPTMMSSEMHPQGTKTDKLISILKPLNADIYLSGPAADSYLDKSLFEKACINLEYKSYDYEPYAH